MLVNSFHHQAIKKMPAGLKATAHAADGGYKQFLKVFELFVDEAVKYSAKK